MSEGKVHTMAEWMEMINAERDRQAAQEAAAVAKAEQAAKQTAAAKDAAQGVVQSEFGLED